MTFSSCPNRVAKKSCSRLLPLIWRANRILYHISPPALLELSVFLARVGCQSFFSGHFSVLAKSTLMQQIMALLSTRATILVLSPPSTSWRVRGMVIPHFVMVVLISGDKSKEVSLSH